MGTKNQPSKFDCYAKLEPDEPYFVLMGRDPSAAFLVMLWAELRRGLDPDDPKAEEAVQVAFQLAAHADALGKRHDEEFTLAWQIALERTLNLIRELRT